MKARDVKGGADASRASRRMSPRLQMRSLAAHEAGKLFLSPALWSFLALCLAFNALLLTVNAPNVLIAFTNETSHVTRELGQRIDEDFLAALAERAETPNEEVLLEAARAAENVFDGYSAADLGSAVVEKISSSSIATHLMTIKYELLETRVDDLAKSEAALDVYVGPVTHDVHQFLFGSLAPALVAEAAAFGMLAALHLLSFEHRHRTAALVYSTAAGRRVQRVKAVTAAAATLAVYAVLCAVTLGVFFLQWDFSGLWNASVSSQFNYLVIDLILRPFITWADFTVAGYLTATLALGGALALCCTLLAAAIGTLAHNAYFAAISLALILLSPLAIRSALTRAGLWIACYLVSLSPPAVWMDQFAWFTEAGGNALIPWQETIGTTLSLVTLIAACALSLRRFNGKDVASCDF